jgi:vacuolar protein sorting-associated protein IST1
VGSQGRSRLFQPFKEEQTRKKTSHLRALVQYNNIKDMFLFGGSFDERKMKANMKMALQRITGESNKQKNITKSNKKDISRLLSEGKKELAKIKCEHIIRTDDMIEAYGVLELFLELLHERSHYINQAPKGALPAADLLESIASVIFCAKRLQIDELTEVSRQFGYKYNSEFIKDAEANNHNCVNKRLFEKVTLLPIKAALLNGYMIEIATAYGVEYIPDEIKDEDQPAVVPTGSSVPIAPASNLTAAYKSSYPVAPHANPTFSSGAAAAVGVGVGVAVGASEQSFDGERNGVGQKHGRGTLEFADGTYIGNFFKDMRHGEGKMIYKTRSERTVQYVGAWWEGCRQGFGVIKSVKLDGQETVLYEGQWWGGVPKDDRARSKLQADLLSLECAPTVVSGESAPAEVEATYAYLGGGGGGDDGGMLKPASAHGTSPVGGDAETIFGFGGTPGHREESPPPYPSDDYQAQSRDQDQSSTAEGLYARADGYANHTLPSAPAEVLPTATATTTAPAPAPGSIEALQARLAALRK